MDTHKGWRRGLTWTTAALSEGQLRNAGDSVLDFRTFRDKYILPSRTVTASRPSLDNAAAPLLHMLSRNPYGIARFRVDFAFVPERLAVEADGRAWHDADRDAARDAFLETLGWRTIRFTGSQIYRNVDDVVAQTIAALADRSDIVTFTEPEAADRVSIWRRFWNWLTRRNNRDTVDPYVSLTPIKRPIPPWKADLDNNQRLAVDSMEGVVQVIAPAGSGKTRTMIGRVQELISRGVPASRILCSTFNRAAREELEDRLKTLGIGDVEVRNFHALGRHILDEEGLLRASVGTVSYGQWRRIAKLAMDSTTDGVWIDAPAERCSNERRRGSTTWAFSPRRSISALAP